MHRRATTIARIVSAAALAAGALCACSPPSPPDEERRPEPRAEAPPQSGLVQAADAY